MGIDARSVSGTSSGSSGSWVCPYVGRPGSVDYCPHCKGIQTLGKICEALYSVSTAPLCSLPQYMASRYPRVRRRANARFDELQNGVALPPLSYPPRILRIWKVRPQGGSHASY